MVVGQKDAAEAASSPQVLIEPSRQELLLASEGRPRIHHQGVQLPHHVAVGVRRWRQRRRAQRETEVSGGNIEGWATHGAGLARPPLQRQRRGVHAPAVAHAADAGYSWPMSKAPDNKRSSQKPRLVLKRGRAKPLWHGHPWVYAQAVHRYEGEVTAGVVVDVHDDRGAFVGRAVANPGSAIAARVLTRDADEAIDGAWLRRRLDTALALRQRLGLPGGEVGQETDCYRLVNSEGDGLPGLVIDVYGDAVALQRTGVGYEPLFDELVSHVDELLSPTIIAEVSPGSFAEVEGLEVKPRLLKGESASTEVKELGLRYRVDLFEGQKTGLYLDQRENHALIRRLARDAKVLDVYSYVGGFALNAAKGGAASVLAVDASARAVKAVADHAAENGLGDQVQTLEADAFRALSDVDAGSMDLVIIDPPKFARSRRELDAALKGYKKLHRRAIRALAPGGILLSAVCSQLVRTEELTRLLAHAAVEQGRNPRLLETRGPGPDHPRPPAFGEGDYLKVLVCQID